MRLTDQEKEAILAKRKRDQERIVHKKRLSFCGTCGSQIDKTEVNE